jgi:hypothetical protein
MEHLEKKLAPTRVGVVRSVMITHPKTCARGAMILIRQLSVFLWFHDARRLID